MTARLVLAAILIAGPAVVPASAQIYVWRDASGQMILSDSPRPDAEIDPAGTPLPTKFDLAASARHSHSF